MTQRRKPPPYFARAPECVTQFSPEVLQFKADENIHHDHQEGGAGVRVLKINVDDFRHPVLHGLSFLTELDFTIGYSLSPS